MRIRDWSSDVCSSDLRFRKKRRVEERINTFRHLTANRIGEVWSPLDHDVRAIAPYKTGLFRLRVGDHLYSPPLRDGNRVVGEKPGPAGYGQEPHRFQIGERSEEHTSELQSLMRISYAVFCLKNKKQNINKTPY